MREAQANLDPPSFPQTAYSQYSLLCWPKRYIGINIHLIAHYLFRAAEEHGCSSLHHGVNLDKAKEELSKLQTINNTILSQLV